MAFIVFKEFSSTANAISSHVSVDGNLQYFLHSAYAGSPV